MFADPVPWDILCQQRDGHCVADYESRHDKLISAAVQLVRESWQTEF